MREREKGMITQYACVFQEVLDIKRMAMRYTHQTNEAKLQQNQSYGRSKAMAEDLYCHNDNKSTNTNTMQNQVNLNFTDTKTVDTVSGKQQRVLRTSKKANEKEREKKRKAAEKKKLEKKKRSNSL